MFAGGREVKPCDLTDVVAEEGASRDLFAIKLDVGEEPAPGSATLYGGGGDYVVHMPDTSTKREMGPFL
jgi:hypothetical protein